MPGAIVVAGEARGAGGTAKNWRGGCPASGWAATNSLLTTASTGMFLLELTPQGELGLSLGPRQAADEGASRTAPGCGATGAAGYGGAQSRGRAPADHRDVRRSGSARRRCPSSSTPRNTARRAAGLPRPLRHRDRGRGWPSGAVSRRRRAGLFRYPRAHEDDAARAVRAALAIVDGPRAGTGAGAAVRRAVADPHRHPYRSGRGWSAQASRVQQEAAIPPATSPPASRPRHCPTPWW